MQTLIDCAILIGGAFIFNFISPFILNIGGLPGALVGRGATPNSSQFAIATIASAIGQSYIYLCYTALIVSWTISRIEGGHGIKYIIWVVAFFVNIIPIGLNYSNAVKESIEDNYINPQVKGLKYTQLIALLGFFIFALAPMRMKPLWEWIPFVS